MTHEQTRAQQNWRRLAYAKLVVLLAILAVSNYDAVSNFAFYLSRREFGPAAVIAIVWIFSLISLVGVGFNANFWVRLFWGSVTAISLGFVFVFEGIAHTRLILLDMMSLLNSAKFVGEALGFYFPIFLTGLLLSATWFLAFLFPPLNGKSSFGAWKPMWALMPLVPVVGIACMYAEFGGILYILPPRQLTAISLMVLTTYELGSYQMPVRQPVNWMPDPGKSKGNIVLLVDETLRADYLDFTFGNPFTPKLAAQSGDWINFGPSVSTGSCSNYSNALLRFGASRQNIQSSVSENATLFDYARHAGYRTVYIDAQAGIANRNPLLKDRSPGLMNYMTLDEKLAVDDFYAITNVPLVGADEELARIVSDELKRGGPVFIYANKYGSHFPYDWDYPPSEVKFHPTMAEAGDSAVTRIASYRNALAWSVDHFLDYFISIADLRNTTVIFTGDHGENFYPSRAGHCQMTDVDPRTGFVPLMVRSADKELQKAFNNGASLSKGRASQFMIAPTVYRLLGYSRGDIATRYDESLFDGTQRPSDFTFGDVFNIVPGGINTQHVDLNASYLEPEAAEVKRN